MNTRASAARKKASRTVPAALKRELPASSRTESRVLALLLIVATIAIYFPVTHHPFVNYDDSVYVLDNTHIKSGLDLETISWAFTTFYQANWHPLTWLSHAADVQLFHLEPGGHHDVNLLLHVVNAMLLFWVLRRATGQVGPSAMVAGLFALHPLNVESVAWIAERKNLLSMLFFLLGLGAYRGYAWAFSDPKTATARKADGGRPLPGRYAVVMLLFALGLMAKPQIITFPFVLLLWDYWPLRRMKVGGSATAAAAATATSEASLPQRTFWWLVKEKIPLFVMSGGSAVVTMVAQKRGGAVTPLAKFPFSIRLTNAIVSYASYIGKTLWPVRLAPMYPHPWHALPLREVLPSLLLLGGITALAIVGRRYRYLPVGWFWFLGTMVPMIGLVHVGGQAMADRYAYLPLIGVFIMLCWRVAELVARYRIPPLAVRSASVVVLLALAIVTHRQLGYWSDNIRLWTHTLQVTSDNYIAHDNLALLLMEQGQTDEALKHYNIALAIYPSDPTSNLQLAVYDHQHGRLREAVGHYDQVMSITTDRHSRSHLLSNKGLVYLDLRDNGEARKNLEQAVELDPGNYRGWLGLGVVAERSGDLNVAIEDYRRANSIKPLKVTYQLLAKVLEQTGRNAEAQAAREQARLSEEESASQVVSNPFLEH